VPEDEADEVRRLLASNGVDYYETPPGGWGISPGAIWLKDEAQRERAEALLSDYHERRAQAARAEYERLRRQGKAESFLDRLRHDPLRVVIYTAIIAVVLYLSVKPFLDLGS